MKEIQEYLERVDSLENEFRALSTKFADLAGILERGLPPNAAILERAQDAASAYAGLLAEIDEILGSENESERTLDQLRRVLTDRLGAAAREALQSSEAALKRVLRFRHVDEEAFKPLEEAQAAAQRLLSIIDNVGPFSAATDEAFKEAAPLEKLDLLVCAGDNLSDDEASEATEEVSEAFGRLLAVAAVRGKIGLAAEDRTDGQGTASNSEVSGEGEPGPDTEMEVTPHSSASKGDSNTGNDVAGADSAKSDGGNDGGAAGDATGGSSKRESTTVTLPESAGGEHDATFWSLIAGDRLGLAAMLADVTGDSSSRIPIPAGLTRAALLSRHLLRRDRDIAEAIRESLESIDHVSGDGATQIFMFGACLVPALMVPSSRASLLLKEFRPGDGFPAAYELAMRIVEAGTNLANVQTPILQGVRDLSSWEDEMNGIRAEIESWLEDAPRSTIKFQRASEVWRYLVSKGGEIQELLSTLISRSGAASGDQINQLQKLEDGSSFRRLVNDIDRKSLGRKKGERIHSRAYDQLCHRKREAVDLARRWLAIQSERPDQSQFVSEEISALREDIELLVPRVRSELEAFIESRFCEGGECTAAAAAAETAIDRLEWLFQPGAGGREAEVNPIHLFRRELLLCAEIDLDEDLVPRNPPEAVFEAIKEVAGRSIKWIDAFQSRLERGDVHGAAIALNECQGLNPEVLAEAESRLVEERKNRRKALEIKLTATEVAIHKALAHGLFAEAEAAKSLHGINEIRGNLDRLSSYSAFDSWLGRLEEKIAGAAHFMREQAMRRLEALDDELVGEHIERLSSLIQGGDIPTAYEFMSRLEKKQPIPDNGQEHLPGVAGFFPERARQIKKWLDDIKHQSRIVLGTVKNRGKNEYLDLSQIPKPQADAAHHALQIWFTVRKSRSVSEGELRQLLDYLDFSGVRINRLGPRGKGKSFSVDVEHELVCDRKLCPVPFFGSQAEGKLKVVGLWDLPGERGILSAVGETAQSQKPTLVLYFGRLTERQRIELARECLSRRRALLVLDEILMVYLAGCRGLRLPTFFAATLPFSHSEPFVTTSSLVPPEMFYGRAAELASIKDNREGRCFVFGGRQLGKTALLREAARQFHSPAEGRVGVWIDLKGEEIGDSRRANEIWWVIARYLKKHGVFPENFDPPKGRSERGILKVIDGIENWLQDDPNRRILLLLDEADKFLEEDAKGKNVFLEAGRLKSAMDRTNRNFKVVFAGLHNVLRMTEHPNHPLAHLGDPINVGPLIESEEWNEARRLIRDPLAALGYKFASDDLVVRMLAQTNFYPSLIQLYCAEVLKTLRSDADSGRFTLPKIIENRHIDEAFNSRALREAIRERFHLTLQLDPRYEVIAYAIAFETMSPDALALDDGSTLIDKGLRTHEIFRESLRWWPDGFNGLSDREFRTLLEEMVGLGVLRVVGSNRYGLRNSNTAMLMGTGEDIENVLLKTREGPTTFEPAIYHARPQDQSDPRRHPLTFEQEAQLEPENPGVAVIIGIPAAGSHFLPRFLEDRAGEGAGRLLVVSANDLPGFEREAFKLVGQKKEPFLVIPADVPWTESWIDSAVELVRRGNSRQQSVRCAFLGDQQSAWLLSDVDTMRLEDLGVTIMPLRPWHDAFVRQWLEDLNLPAHNKLRDRLLELTGHWQGNLLRVYNHLAKGTVKKWDEAVYKLEEIPAGEGGALAHDFGLDVKEASGHLKTIVDLNQADTELSDDDLHAMPELVNVPVELLRRTVRWCELMGTALPHGPDSWKLDPILVRLVAGTE